MGFLPFSRLAPEIRIEVWKYSLDENDRERPALTTRRMHCAFIKGSAPKNLYQMSKRAVKKFLVDSDKHDAGFLDDPFTIRFDARHQSACVEVCRRLSQVNREARDVMSLYWSSHDPNDSLVNIRNITLDGGHDACTTPHVPNINTYEDLVVISAHQVPILMWWIRINHSCYPCRYRIFRSSRCWSARCLCRTKPRTRLQLPPLYFAQHPPPRQVGIEIDETWLKDRPQTFAGLLEEPDSPRGHLARAIRYITRSYTKSSYMLTLNLFSRDYQRSGHSMCHSTMIFRDGGLGEFQRDETANSSEVSNSMASRFYRWLKLRWEKHCRQPDNGESRFVFDFSVYTLRWVMKKDEEEEDCPD